MNSITKFAYGGAQDGGQIVSSTDSAGGIPSWTVFVGILFILLALASLYYYTQRNKSQA